MLWRPESESDNPQGGCGASNHDPNGTPPRLQPPNVIPLAPAPSAIRPFGQSRPLSQPSSQQQQQQQQRQQQRQGGGEAVETGGSIGIAPAPANAAAPPATATINSSNSHAPATSKHEGLGVAVESEELLQRLQKARASGGSVGVAGAPAVKAREGGEDNAGTGELDDAESIARASKEELIARIRRCLAGSPAHTQSVGQSEEALRLQSAPLAATGGFSSAPTDSAALAHAAISVAAAPVQPGPTPPAAHTASLSVSPTKSAPPRLPGVCHPVLARKLERRRRQLSRELCAAASEEHSRSRDLPQHGFTNAHGGGGGRSAATAASTSSSGRLASGIGRHLGLSASHISKAGAPLTEELRLKGTSSQLPEYCEASAAGLLQHVTSDAGADQSLQQMLDTLELAALYQWLGRNGEEAHRYSARTPKTMSAAR
jgi:hypothetical protein